MDFVRGPVDRDSIFDSLFHLNPRAKDDGGVVTIVAVTTMTAPKTFAGSAVYVTKTGDDTKSTGTTTSEKPKDTSSTTKTTKNSKTTATSSRSTSSAVEASITSKAVEAAATSSSASASVSSSSISALSNAQATPLSDSSNSSTNGGLSGGAKAGIAFGVLIPLAALLLVALFFMRKKKQQREAGQRLDDEKADIPTPPPSVPAVAPVVAPQPTPRITETLSAPRLSLRPQTEFDPRMSRLAGPGPTVVNTGAGADGLLAAGAMNRSASPSNQNPVNTPGSAKANDPANPFGNHAETLSHGQSPVVGLGLATAPRAPSPGRIEAADFPLPSPAAPSEKATSIITDTSTDNISLTPSNSATTSNLNLIVPATVAPAGAANKGSVPPIEDNVYRVQLDFKPSMEDELEIRAGQLVRIMHAYDDGWALCMRMDRSQQGVVPRTCLSKNSVKPRQGPPPGARPNGPGPRGPGPQQMRGPGPQGRPMTPQGGRNSPALGRPMTPQGGRNSPAPYAQPPRSMSPAGPRHRAQSNAGPPPFAHGPQMRSMSPGPYGPGGAIKPPPPLDLSGRTRANSLGHVKPLSPSKGGSVSRKPVPGQAV